jgi:hypothetical protein
MRRLAHLGYFAAALCFALTFFDVVYQGNSLVHFTGQELVTGTTFHRPFQIGPATLEIGHISVLPAAGIAVAALAMAAGLFWMKGRAGSAIALALGAVAAICLLLVRTQVASEIVPHFPGTEIRYAIAYWCSVALTCLGMLLSAAAFLHKEKQSAP